jgi:hypothetical protein
MVAQTVASAAAEVARQEHQSNLLTGRQAVADVELAVGGTALEDFEPAHNRYCLMATGVAVHTDLVEQTAAADRIAGFARIEQDFHTAFEAEMGVVLTFAGQVGAPAAIPALVRAY